MNRLLFSDRIGEGHEPLLVNPRTNEAEQLRTWLTECLGSLGSPTREDCYSLQILLQHRYFYARWRSDAAGWEALHTAYESCFRTLDSLWEATDPPLPVMVSPPPLSPEPEPEDVDVFLMEPDS